jgi:hypothetical protein
MLYRNTEIHTHMSPRGIEKCSILIVSWLQILFNITNDNMNLETVDLKEAIVATNSRITIGVCAMDKKARNQCWNY